MSKYDIPLDMLLAIEPLVLPFMDRLTAQRNAHTFYAFEARESDVPFHFVVYRDAKQFFSNPAAGNYAYEARPAANNSNVAQTKLGPLPAIVSALKEWLSRIESIYTTPSVYDDPVLKSYEAYYTEAFKFNDANADIDAFTPKQQYLIEQELDKMAEAIKDKSQFPQGEMAEQLVAEVNAIKEDLQHSTKNQFAKRMGKVGAKFFKYCKPAAKYIVDKCIEVGIKAVIEWQLPHLPGSI